MEQRVTGRPKLLTAEQEDQMYAEYISAGRAGSSYRKSYDELALDWQCSKFSVYKAIKAAKKRHEVNGSINPDLLILKPADVLGQVERLFTRIDGLKRETALIEERARNLFHQIPKHSRFSKVDVGRLRTKDGGQRSRKVKIHFLKWSTRDFELGPLYGLEENHKNTAEETAYEKHRYVVRELLETEYMRTEAVKGDEDLCRLRKEVDRKKLLSWAETVMAMRNLENSWEDLEKGIITEPELEALSEYLTGLERKNEAEGIVPGEPAKEA